MAIPAAIVGALASGAPKGLFTNDGSSLAGWTVSGVTVDNSVGNPAPSLRAWPSRKYAFIAPAGTDFVFEAGHELSFDAKLGSSNNALVDVFFGCSSGGAGTMLRLDSRTTSACGIAATSSWTAWDSPTGASFSTTDANWHSYRIVFKGNAIDVYKDGVLVIADRSFSSNGPYIGIQGDNGTYGGNVDNILLT